MSFNLFVFHMRVRILMAGYSSELLLLLCCFEEFFVGSIMTELDTFEVAPQLAKALS